MVQLTLTSTQSKLSITKFKLYYNLNFTLDTWIRGENENTSAGKTCHRLQRESPG
jgi:hypothetical protein